MKDLTTADLTVSMSELLAQCGADAQSHPLALDGTVLRFKANPIVRKVTEMINLNDLWMRCDMDVKEHRLGMRAFYWDMGYSLCGYLEIFGEQLDAEEAA